MCTYLPGAALFPLNLHVTSETKASEPLDYHIRIFDSALFSNASPNIFANICNLNVLCYSDGTEIRLIPATILRRASKLFYNFFSQHELLPDTLSRDKKKPVQNSGRKIICHPRICDTHYQHTIHPIRVEQVTQPECSKGAKDEVKPGGPLNFNFSIMECVSGGPVW